MFCHYDDPTLFFEKHPEAKLSGKLKNVIEILVGQAILELLIKTIYFACIDQ